MRSQVVLLAVLLALPIGLTPARATAPLQVDAGQSAFVLDGGSVSVVGAVAGGTPPYAYAWDVDGSTAGLSAPTSLVTSLDSSAYATGDHNVTLTVTDHDGTVASDTVPYRFSDRTSILDTVVSFGTTGAAFDGFGVGPRVSTVGAQSSPFTVATGTSRLEAELDWSDSTLDTFTFDLVDPSGAHQGTYQGVANPVGPQTITVDAPLAGSWHALVSTNDSAPTETAHVSILATGAKPLPDFYPPLQEQWGTKDTQTLHAAPGLGVAPFTYKWDTDNDGVYDLTGNDVAASLGVGSHTIRSRIIDAGGWRSEGGVPVLVHSSDHAFWANCGGDLRVPNWSMEFSATGGTCWMHDGHHTYFMGGATYSLGRMDGSLYSVEQMFAPSTDVDANLQTKIAIEASLDGLTWTSLGSASYDLLNERQGVPVHLVGSGQHFRFFRFHEPLSASQGLSGYLDGSDVVIEANDVSAAPTPALTTQTKELSCANSQIMEAFFTTHPCTFGGVDRYDSASFFHTYVAGDGANLTAIGGSFTLAPFRSDDWYQGHETAPLTTLAYVQVSADGVHFTNVASVTATYGVPASFHVDVPGGTSATFVRVFPEYHADFNDDFANAPLHHTRGFILASNVTLTGDMP
ncbi:MAG: hypothetical protein QOE90_3026 [Thermoplasmata archaeon]|jgi:hypothetical protein|nr:hypothetical protein [Thermoplasmata archaeon]